MPSAKTYIAKPVDVVIAVAAGAVGGIAVVVVGASYAGLLWRLGRIAFVFFATGGAF